MPRRVRYQVAASLDGFIAGPNGEYDWIVGDPAIDFAVLFKQFDAAVMGRKTYALVEAEGSGDALPGMEAFAFSRTLTPKEYRGVRVTNENPVEVVRALKKKQGRDIWLFGGGELFRTLLDAKLVDTVEIAVMPVLLGAGIPLLPPGGSAKLVLSDQKTLRGSGIVVLAYQVKGSTTPPPQIRHVKTRPPRPSPVRKARTTRRKKPKA